MAIHFFIKPLPDRRHGKIFARVRCSNPSIDIKLSTRQVLPLAVWEQVRATRDMALIEQYPRQFSILERMERQINFVLNNALPDEDLRWRICQLHRRILATADQSVSVGPGRHDNSFMEYYARFLQDARQGRARNIGLNKGKTLGVRTIVNYQQGYRWLQEFQATDWGGRGIGFDEVDKAFFDQYTHFLCHRRIGIGKYRGAEGCSQNTIALRVNEIKSILRRAHEEDGITTNTAYLNKAIRVQDVDVDSVVLSRKELEAMGAVDLSAYPASYAWARDIFMVGVWTAQRVSDYGRIVPDDIKRYRRSLEVTDSRGRRTVDVVEGAYISIRQKKTGKLVSIPVNGQLQQILDRYGNRLPHLWTHRLNRCIKQIARLAGITEKVKVTTIRGGKTSCTYVEKCELIHSHTARKTGATLMYNEGVDVYDIMAITGHSSVDMLKKYVKADSGDTACRIAAKYRYFK